MKPPSKDTRHLLAIVGILYVAPVVGLVVFVLLSLIAGPLVAALVLGVVGFNVALMRREYREYRSRRRLSRPHDGRRGPLPGHRGLRHTAR